MNEEPTQPSPLSVQLDMLDGYTGLALLNGKPTHILGTAPAETCGPNKGKPSVWTYAYQGVSDCLAEDVDLDLNNPSAFEHLFRWVWGRSVNVDVASTQVPALMGIVEGRTSWIGPLFDSVGAEGGPAEVLARHMAGETTDHDRGSLRAVCLRLVQVIQNKRTEP